nr:MAG TPA: hypothetical protein [Caudoviricetes sp.]
MFASDCVIEFEFELGMNYCCKRKNESVIKFSTF